MNCSNVLVDFEVMKILVTIIFSLAMCISAAGQEAKLFDEFGKITTEDLMARLDGLRGELYRTEGSVALLRTYRQEKNYLGFPSRDLARMKVYLTNQKVDEKKIAVQECDGSTDPKYQFYIVPASTLVTDCPNTLTIPKETTLFDSYFYWRKNDVIDDCCSIEGSDISGAVASLRTFANLLQNSPASRAYVIAYNGTNVWGYNNKTLRPLEKPGTATRTAVNAKKFLIESGIGATRIVAINGGYRDSNRNVELWFVPEGGTIPKPTPNYFPRKLKKPARR